MESYLALAAGVVAGAAGCFCIIHWQQKKEKKALVRRSSSEKVQCNEFATTPSALLPTMQRVSTVIRDELPDQQVDRKIVYLVRHAQAAHNILEAAAKKAVKDRGGSDAEAEEARKAVLDNPDNFDAALSVKGQSQASASGVELASLFERTHYPPPECVLVSPLQRTLHTATLLFPDHPKMSAHERLREKRTGKPCDERRPAAEAARQFPHISFDTIAWLDARSDKGHKFRPEFLEGNAEVVRFLCAEGCEKESVDEKGWTPLHLAAIASNIEVVQLLCAEGCNKENCQFGHVGKNGVTKADAVAVSEGDAYKKWWQGLKDRAAGGGGHHDHQRRR